MAGRCTHPIGLVSIPILSSVKTGGDANSETNMANYLQGPRMAEMARHHRYRRVHRVCSWKTARGHIVEGQEDYV